MVLVALDGVFLRANASKNQLLMHSTITKDINSITLKIEDYLTQLETADKHNKESDLTSKHPTPTSPTQTNPLKTPPSSKLF